MTRRISAVVAAMMAIVLSADAFAQHPAFRLKGRVITERGEPLANADVGVEALFGYFAGTFAGQRTFTAQTNNKGEWSVGGMQPGIWLFEATAPGHIPETVVLPIRILTTVSMGTSGMSLLWELVLKPVPVRDDATGEFLTEVADLARNGKADLARSSLQRLTGDPDADYLAGAARIAMVAHDIDLARTLFVRALDRDPSSYRAALGVASMFLWQRDFDNASRAFDAARNRTRDKGEQRFISAAIGDLATIKAR
jgi:hypothetical protein